MWPSLTMGAINQILNGADVPAPTFQILGCKKIPGSGNDRYCLLISDGVTGCPFALLSTRLSHMVTNKELEKFTIVKIDKYVLSQVQADRKVIVFFNLTVLVPGNEVNEKLGKPIIMATGNVKASENAPTAGNAPAAQNEPPVVNSRAQQKDNYEPQDIDGSAPAVHPINVLTSSTSGKTLAPEKELTVDRKTNLPVKFKKSWPSLSTGAIQRILNDENVDAPILQILGYRKFLNGNMYQLLISDGVSFYPFASLSKEISHLAIDKKLESFTIVKVNEWVCKTPKPDQTSTKIRKFWKVFRFTDVTVLVPGIEVNEKLGNPMDTFNCRNKLAASDKAWLANNGVDIDSTVLVPRNEVNQKLIYSSTNLNEQTISGMAQQEDNYDPQDIDGSAPAVHLINVLTTGAINRILNDEDVLVPTLQILGCKKICGDGQYRLQISDGVIGYPFGILDSELGHLVTNNKLEQYSIVKVDKYVCNQCLGGGKVIKLLNITVLVPGTEVNKKLGNPKNSWTCEKTQACRSELNVNRNTQLENIYGSNGMNGSNLPVKFKKSWPSFSTGAIQRILNDENVDAPILQILGYRKFLNGNMYQLLISDGVSFYPFASLSKEISHLAIDKKLESFTIVKVNEWVCKTPKPDQTSTKIRKFWKVFRFTDVTVLVPGNEVNEKLGNPMDTFNCRNKLIASDKAWVENNGVELTVHSINTLTPGAIHSILNGEDFQSPILQILGWRKSTGSGNDRYRILISDGVTSYSSSNLGTQLNRMVTSKKLQKFTVVKVDKYVCKQVKDKGKVIILLNLTVLFPGNKVNRKLGNPISLLTDGNEQSADVGAQVENNSGPPEMNSWAPAEHVSTNNIFLTYLIYELNLRRMLNLNS